MSLGNDRRVLFRRGSEQELLERAEKLRAPPSQILPPNMTNEAFMEKLKAQNIELAKVRPFF